jgi:murein DD-endopeptidase MepM/ murein hydrolase activator NlpD
MRYFFGMVFIAATFTCGTTNKTAFNNQEKNINSEHAFIFDTNYVTKKFRNPVGKPPGKGYYDANPFMNKAHLGEDWNGNKGGNSDLGDTVYAAANGYINFAEDIGGGWGNVIRILHQLPPGNKFPQVESLYAHFEKVFVKPNTYIKIGAPIGTIGTANGIYPAHLHFEMRHDPTMEIGGGYSSDTTGYLNPKSFIKEFNQLNP